ncbi:MAG: oligosaccharide flippase family protein [Rhodoferax sp.]|nr:oligosaccharide flippase family protein [Rhodoferax sp.]
MSTRRSLFYSFLDRYASLLIAVVSSMVIARLLTPTEVGVFSVTMVLLMFVATVRDMGAGQYLVQEKELTTERIRAVWAVQLGLGLGLAALVVLASHPVAVFYNEPRMRDIMLVVALNYAINPFGSLTYAWLMREMQFESVALMRFSASASGAVVAIWLAWKGHGPISLAYGSMASTLVNALMSVYFRPKSFPWLPGVSEIRRVLVFGSQLTVSSIVGTLSGSAPELLVGKLQSLTAAGLYSRASGLVHMFHRLFVDAVGAVCLPWFARQSREHGSFVEPFLKATAYVTAFGWSFCVAVVCLAHPIIQVLYGDQWYLAVELARLLAVATAFSVPASLCHTALLSSGAVTVIARVTITSALQSVFFASLGASQGLIVMGVAMIASAAVSATLWLRATSIHIQLPLMGLLRMLGQSMVVALLAGMGPAIALWMYGAHPDAPLMPLLVGCTLGLAGFFLGIILVKHPLRTEITKVLAQLRSTPDGAP